MYDVAAKLEVLHPFAFVAIWCFAVPVEVTKIIEEVVKEGPHDRQSEVLFRPLRPKSI